MKKLIICLLVIIFSVAISNRVTAIIEEPEIVKGQYIIMLKNDKKLSKKDLHDKVSKSGGKLVRALPEIGIALAAGDASFAKKLSKNKDVEEVVPEINMKWIPDEEITHIQQITAKNEWLYGYQWNMRAIDADKAWQAGYAGAGVRVAVLDTGIDPYHPDLFPNIDFASSKSFVEHEPFIEDHNGHGTYVSGIIAAADNDYGVIGVAPEAKIIAVKVEDQNGNGNLSWVLSGIYYAAGEADADVINMSLGSRFHKSNAHQAPYLSAFNRAIKFAAQQGATVVSAAGNAGINFNLDKDAITLPAESKNGLAVSATAPVCLENFDDPAHYTNYGTSVIDVAAPGGDFLCPDPNNWYLDMVPSTWPPNQGQGGYYFAWGAGTSQAAPHVAGVAALIIGKNGGEMNPAQVKAIIKQSADDLGKPGMDDYYGHGRVNAYKAVTIK